MNLSSHVFGKEASQPNIDSRSLARSNHVDFKSDNISKSMSSRSASMLDSLGNALSIMGNAVGSLFAKERQSTQEHLQATTLQKVVIQTGESGRLLSSLLDEHNVGLNLLVLIDKKLEELLKRDQCDGKKTTAESLMKYAGAAALVGTVAEGAAMVGSGLSTAAGAISGAATAAVGGLGGALGALLGFKPSTAEAANSNATRLPGNQMSAGELAPILETIKARESADAGYYTAVNYQAVRAGYPKSIPNLTDMTVREVQQLQQEMINKQNALGMKSPSSAVGAYQMIKGTLESWRKGAGVSLDEKFTPEIQDKIASYGVQEALRAGGGDVSTLPLTWLTGNPQGRTEHYTPDFVKKYQENWMKELGRQQQVSSSSPATPAATSRSTGAALNTASTAARMASMTTAAPTVFSEIPAAASTNPQGIVGGSSTDPDNQLSVSLPLAKLKEIYSPAIAPWLGVMAG